MQTAEKQQEKQPVDRVHPELSDTTLLEKNLVLQAQVDAQKKQITYYEKVIKLYEEAERLSKIQRFGPSSEKSKFQVNLFDEAELDEALSDLKKQIEAEEAEQEPQTKKKKPRKKT